MRIDAQQGLWKWRLMDSLGTTPKPVAPNLTTSLGKLAQHKAHNKTIGHF
jgi:hypothetical protein